MVRVEVLQFSVDRMRSKVKRSARKLKKMTIERGNSRSRPGSHRLELKLHLRQCCGSGRDYLSFGSAGGGSPDIVSTPVRGRDASKDRSNRSRNCCGKKRPSWRVHSAMAGPLRDVLMG